MQVLILTYTLSNPLRSYKILCESSSSATFPIFPHLMQNYMLKTILLVLGKYKSCAKIKRSSIIFMKLANGCIYFAKSCDKKFQVITYFIHFRSKWNNSLGYTLLFSFKELNRERSYFFRKELSIFSTFRNQSEKFHSHVQQLVQYKQQ